MYDSDLSAGWFPEEGRFDPVSLGSVLVLHGQPDVVGLLPVLVLHHHLVVPGVLVGQVSEMKQFEEVVRFVYLRICAAIGQLSVT